MKATFTRNTWMREIGVYHFGVAVTVSRAQVLARKPGLVVDFVFTLGKYYGCLSFGR